MAITLTLILAIALTTTPAPTQVITQTTALAIVPPLTTDFAVSLENF